MKCCMCGIEISSSFMYAIKNNVCPCCGKSIMPNDKLASFLSLKTLLEENFKSIDVEKVSTLIIANFELKQIFKEDLKDQKKEGITNFASGVAKEDTSQINVEEDAEAVIAEGGIKLEPYDKKKAKDTLQKLRDEALNGAIDDRYGISMEDEVIIAEDPKANAELLKQRQKQLDAQQAIDGGSGGGFRRG